MSFLVRKTFPQYNIPLANFKGHHRKALTKFGHLGPQIDVLIEVRDSRAPLATTNVLFDRVLANKKKLVVYTKKDLSVLPHEVLRRWHGDDYRAIDARNRKDARAIVQTLRHWHQQMDPPPPLGLRAMIIGMPNVGKSTLVNTLREVGLPPDGEAISSKRRKVARTGGQPGVTRATSEMIRIDENVLVHDTPGVFLPTVKSVETMLALCLVGCVPSGFVDPVIQADYLLYMLNLQSEPGARYSEYMDHPTNSVDELLYNIARTRGKLASDGSYDEVGMANTWLNGWRQGKSRAYRGLFEKVDDVGFRELRALLKEEKGRVSTMGIHQSLVDSFGADGTSRSKHRRRTAKDRQFDLNNRLFKN